MEVNKSIVIICVKQLLVEDDTRKWDVVISIVHDFKW